jgi:hypothetical protein
MLTVALMPGGKPTAIRDAARREVVPEPVLADGETILITPAAPAAASDAERVARPG